MQNRIKKLREILGLNQKEFADKIGVDITTVYSWERTGRLPIRKIELISQIFGVNYAWLIDGVGEIFINGTQQYNSEPNDIQSRLRKLRKYLDMTQKDFAARLGLVYTNITNWENTGRIPRTKQDLICNTFGVNPQWLESGIGEMFCGNATASIPPREYALQNGCDEVTATLFERFMALPENEKKAFARILTQIVSGNGSASSLETDATIDNINGSIVLKGTVNSRDITVNNFPEKK